MHYALISILTLIIMSQAFARVNSLCQLTQTPLSLGGYDSVLSTSVHLSAGGRFFAQVNTAGDALFWHLDNPRAPILRLRPDEKLGVRFTSAAFSPKQNYACIDATLLNTGLEQHGRLTIVDMASSSIKANFDTYILGGGGGSKFAFSPSEKYLALALDDHLAGRKIRIFDVKEGRFLEVFFVSPCPVGALAFDGEEHVVATKDICQGDIILWDLQSGAQITRLHQSYNFVDTISSPTSSLIFWDHNTLLAAHASGQEFMQVWDLNTKQVPFDTPWLDFQPILASPNGQELVIADLFGQLNVLKAPDPSTAHIVVPFGTFDLVWSASFSPEGSFLATGSMQGELALLDTVDYATLCEASTNDGEPVSEFAFFDEHNFATLSASGELSAWEIH